MKLKPILLFVGCLAALAAASDVSPVEKVIQMLEDLQTQVIEEGKAEATTYDKFACFCKDMTDDKTQAIMEGQASVDDLSASLGDLVVKREELDTRIGELEALIEELTAEMKEVSEKRAKERATYDENALDLANALVALEGAIQALKASKAKVEGGASLLAIQSVMKTVRTALVMADALNLNPRNQKALSALLQQEPGVPVSDYDFGSDHVIKMLEDLLVSFTDKKNEVDANEVDAKAEHDKIMQAKTDQKKTAEDDLKSTQEEKAKTMDNIASTQQDLTITLATLHDDQAYLKELTAKCETKSKEWDQRSSMRQDELSALTQALTIIKGTVSEKTTERTIRFVQNSATVEPHVVASDVDADSDSDDDDVSFLQVEEPKAKLSLLVKSLKQSPNFLSADSPRDRVVSLLRSKSEELRSQVLATLATTVAKDHFAKIKKLIQELIERLLQEAANEATHKGWCDEQIGKAKQQRDLRSESIRKLNTELEGQEAKRDKLKEQIAVLKTEIAELEDALSKATKQREDESAENAVTVSEAQEGKEAVEQAIDVLSKFYKTAAKATVLAQKGVDDDAPDAGFSGAYKGAQAESGGILGMLDVIRSDFERTITETEKAEAEAQREFIEFERTTKVSIAEKRTAHDALDHELTMLLGAIDDNMSEMREQQDLLDKSIQELEELKPACVDTGMSYEERVARREQEIEALKEALCILDKEGPVQTEGC